MPLFSSIGAANTQTTNRGNERGWARARVITHGYVAGGYKDSSPWKNVNRTVHSTDTTTDLGDQMTRAACYCDGGNSDLYFYVYGIIDAFAGNSSETWSWHMSTSTGRGTNASWNMTVGRDDLGTMVDYEHQGARIYCVGGGSNVTDRFNMKTETMLSVGPTSGSSSDYTATAEGRLRGWQVTSTAATRATQSFQWSNETYSAWSSAPGTDGWGKAVSSYLGRFYMKNGGNLNATLVKCDDNNGTQSSSFPIQDAGEENYQMGNLKGYCLGHYNTAQNNNTYKVNYNVDTYAALGSTAEPKGHAGMSSAALASSYNFNNPAYGTTVPAY